MRLRERLLEIEKLTSMGKMAAGTAHHLNTPLAAMLLRVQMMRERAHRPRPGPTSNVSRATFSSASSSSVGCWSSVAGRPPKGATADRRRLSSVVGFLAPALDSRSVRLSLDVAGVHDEQVLADRSLLEAMFLTLLSNAVDAVCDGGAIAVRCGRIGSGRIEIRIADEGCGIAPAQLPHVFEPFYTTKGPGKGTGLGLAIARSIVLEHGGSIRIESEPARGTVAAVELPIWGLPAGETGP